MIKGEYFRPWNWFTVLCISTRAVSMMHTHENEDSAGSNASVPVRRINTSQITPPYQSTHEPHFSVSF